jgi:HEAT repeat protein
VRAALHSDLDTLRRSIAEEARSGHLDGERAADIAEAVLSREIYAERGRLGARRIRLMRGCSRPLVPILEVRAERQDEGGAEAAMLLLSSGARRPEQYAGRYQGADSGAWRAVSARASTAPSRFTARRRYLTDPDERVRRAALEATLQAPAILDLEPLIEAARLDPDPLSRSLAVRGVGAIGGARAGEALRDLWERASEDVRLTIVEAWRKPRSYRAGGREALLKTAETRTGVTSAAAAGALLADPSVAGAATTLLSRAIAEGASDEQLLALALIPLEAEVVPLVTAAARDPDPNVRVVALERLLSLKSERGAAFEGLRALARGAGEDAFAARAALAAAGDVAVEPLLVAALASADPAIRRSAGLGLIALGRYGRAATLLGDGNADVRVTTACVILQKLH